MLNNINNNENLLGNAQLDRQNEVNRLATNPIKNPYKNIDKGLLIDETAISNEAIKLYEREKDVQYFTKLALSDSNLDDEKAIGQLFAKGILDPFEDEIIKELADNNKLKADLAK